MAAIFAYIYFELPIVADGCERPIDFMSSSDLNLRCWKSPNPQVFSKD